MGGAQAGFDVVGVQRHCAGLGQGSAASYVGAGSNRNACESKNVSCECSACTESRGAAHLPKRVVTLTAIDEDDRRVAGGRECAADLENKECIGVTLGVESKCPRQLGRRTKRINPWRERKSTQIQTRKVLSGRQARRHIVCGYETRLSLGRDRITSVHRSSKGPGAKAGERSTWADSRISRDDGRTCVGHRRGSQDPKAGRVSQIDRTDITFACRDVTVGGHKPIFEYPTIR